MLWDFTYMGNQKTKQMNKRNRNRLTESKLAVAGRDESGGLGEISEGD